MHLLFLSKSKNLEHLLTITSRSYSCFMQNMGHYYLIFSQNNIFFLTSTLCMYLCGRVGEQKMVHLPTDRLNTEPPFTYIGLDMFGPFLIKQHRKEVKRYAIIFTCLPSHAGK